VSLDAFRGLTILGMLLVNNVALDTLTPKTLGHAEWSGEVNFADVVFPWFLLAVGVAVAWSMASLRTKGLTNLQIIGKALARTAILVLLGWIVDSSVAHALVIGLGVLQLIGLSYFFAVLVQLLPPWTRAIVAIVSMAAHWALLKFLPLPDGSVGTFTESANSLRYLNDTYLSPLHLRGLLSVLTTGPLVVIGTFVGAILRSKSGGAWKGLLATGAALTAIGYALKWDLPMNKPLWTASYVLFTAGLGILVLLVFHGLFDHERRSKWAMPLLVLGSNAIFAYVVPVLTKTLILGSIPMASGHTLAESLRIWPRERYGLLAGGLAYTIGYILFWWLVMFVMYRKNVFFKV
jgi:predicted acyltransferase